jgi:drug/metabolite transporter (DMT)-like permease
VTPILLAALSAAVWGIADFSGGKASQRANPVAVTVISQVIGVPVLAVGLLVVPGQPNLGALGWGAAAGIAGLGGIILLYKALSAGAMAVVAPVTAVTAAVVPMGIGLLADRTPGTLALGGAGLAVVAIGLISIGPGAGAGGVRPALVGTALLAGALFGLFFAALGQVTAGAGMWPLLAVRASSIAVGAALMLRGRIGVRLPRPVLPWVAAAGALDILANALYVGAAARGHLSIVAAIASLYPASTVLLALLVNRERLRLLQIAGLGIAATALVLATS